MLAGGEYDALIHKALAEGALPEDIYKAQAVRTVREVADTFLPVFRQTQGADGFVSIEVSPLLARDTEGTLKEARELHKLVSRENIMIKVPATREGIPAIRALISEGIHVNVTLIFSLERYREVMGAYLVGLEDRAARSLPIDKVASVASFFVSRLDTAVDPLLEQKISTDPGLKSLLGKAAIANSKLDYREFETIFVSARFKALEKKGAKKQRPLWASTGTKNPAYSDVVYVEALIGPETVDTMPPATLDAFRDHGRAASNLQEGVSDADGVLRSLEKIGISLAQVTQGLEEAGVKSFSDSYEKILKRIQEKHAI